MLKLPGHLTTEKFLSRHWQKAPLFMPQAIEDLRPAITRNELAWLATLDDVESRLVFTDRGQDQTRYRVATGPFDEPFLRSLPKRDWTLLVHDVEKHLPAFRKLFELVPFVPDWRIDDLMISFAAPGGGVGPHRDNYDVFLCQGVGVREWRLSTESVEENVAASDDLVLLQEFACDKPHAACAGDVLYLPPGVAHWGTARKACITYSIGMRAPPGYADPDLQFAEARPGYISANALRRAGKKAPTLGRRVTLPKQWLEPLAPTKEEISALLHNPAALGGLILHGMARIAFDDDNVYLNGAARSLKQKERESIASLCRYRRLNSALVSKLDARCLRWLLTHGAFDLPEPG